MEKEIRFVETTAARSLTDTFVQAAARRYHYEWKDLKKMRQAAADVRSAIEGQEGFYCVWPIQKKEGLYAGVIVTLGEALDRLQDTYSANGDVEGAYMIEVIACELLKNAYLQFSDYCVAHTCYAVEAFHFFGAEEDFPMEEIRELLACQPEKKVTCNEAYCLKPKKTVVFLAELRDFQKEKDGLEKRNISAAMCAACNKKDCILSTKNVKDGKNNGV